jgi:hypothetical protein
VTAQLRHEIQVLDATRVRLERENARLRDVLAEIRDFAYCDRCASCPRCNTHAIARRALKASQT